jgi:hypothetical protein
VHSAGLPALLGTNFFAEVLFQNLPELSADLGAQTLAPLQPFLLHLFQQSPHKDTMGTPLRDVKPRARQVW